MHSFVTVYSGMTIQIFIKIGSYLTDMEQKISWHSFFETRYTCSWLYYGYYCYCINLANVSRIPSVSLLVVLLVVFPARLTDAPDPCNSNLLMEDLDKGRRNPDTTASFDSAKLCDYQLDECL